jgi:hypothetical protein
VIDAAIKRDLELFFILPALLRMLFIGDKIPGEKLDGVLRKPKNRDRVQARIYHTFYHAFVSDVAADQTDGHDCSAEWKHFGAPPDNLPTARMHQLAS